MRKCTQLEGRNLTQSIDLYDSYGLQNVYKGRFLRPYMEKSVQLRVYRGWELCFIGGGGGDG